MGATQNIQVRPLRTVEIPIRLIEEGKYSVRKSHDHVKIGELAETIKQSGNLQPIIVKPLPGRRYHLIVGSRRLRASKRAGKETISSTIISGLGDADALAMALTENLQREDLTPFEEGWAILKLIKDFRMETSGVAKKIGKDASFIDSRLKLLAAPKELQEMFMKQQLSLAHIVVLAAIPTHEAQARFAKEVIKHRLTVKELTTLLQEKKARKFLDRAERLVLDSKKVRLRIKNFEKYLRLALPQLKGMAYGETMNLTVVLRSLKETIEKSMKQFAD